MSTSVAAGDGPTGQEGLPPAVPGAGAEAGAAAAATAATGAGPATGTPARRGGKAGKKKESEQPLVALVKADVKSWTRSLDKVVQVERLWLDLKVEHGQIRGLRQLEV